MCNLLFPSQSLVDEVVQLCCLADANSRLSITNTTDIAYIDNWIGEGKTALESSLKKLEFLNQRQSSLEELTTTTESYNTSPSDIARTNKVNASQLSQMVLPSVLHRGNTLNLPFPQVLNASNPPLLSTTNDQENCLSILQREFDQQSSQLRHLIEREREAKKVITSDCYLLIISRPGKKHKQLFRLLQAQFLVSRFRS